MQRSAKARNLVGLGSPENEYLDGPANGHLQGSYTAIKTNV